MTNGASAAGGRPNQIGNPNDNGAGTQQQFFNTGAFQTVYPVTGIANIPGTAGRGTISGPDTKRVDLTLAKNIRFTENLRLQLRAEGFNLFNTTNFNTFQAVASSSTFGQILTTRDPRTFQFGIKFLF